MLTDREKSDLLILVSNAYSVDDLKSVLVSLIEAMPTEALPDRDEAELFRMER